MNHPRVPDWHYGDVLTNDEPSMPNDHKVKAIFLSWERIVEHNPTESILTVLILVEPRWAGHVIVGYCGWWVDE